MAGNGRASRDLKQRQIALERKLDDGCPWTCRVSSSLLPAHHFPHPIRGREMAATTTHPDVHSLSTSRLTDKHGRAITDLRVSVTDRCNYKCVYCRTGTEGAQYAELPIADYLRMVRVFVLWASKRSGSPAASRCCARAWST